MSRDTDTVRLSRLPSVSRPLQILAAVMLALIVGVSIHQLLSVRRAIVEDTSRQMARLNMVFAEQTGRATETVDLVLRNAIDMLRTMSLRNTPREMFEEVLRRRISGVRQMRDLTFFDTAGTVTMSTALGPAAMPDAARPLLARIVSQPDTGLQISAPFRDRDNAWIALLARPVRDVDGTLVGMATASMNLSYFEDFYRSVELTENGSIILHHRDGTVLARYPHVDKAIGTSFADLPPFTQVLSHSMAGTLLMESPIDGSIRVTAIRALKAFPLAVMVSVEQSAALADWRHEAWGFVLAALAVCVIVVGLLLLIAQRSRQVEQLVAKFQTATQEAENANQALREQMEERERAEMALRQAQRIEAVGQLTGGVAHDFNNLLTVILGNVDMAERAGGLDDTTSDRMRAIKGAAERGATLTSHLLAFARRQPLQPRAVDLNAVVEGMRDLLVSALGSRIQTRFRLAHDLWPAMVDPTQIELVILNLAINARDAMQGGGRLTITTENCRRGEPARPEEPPAGDYVMVMVGDTGTGMTPDVYAKAFEPFFTTKAPGAGSGLGLSQVFGTARQSGGGVTIDTAPGRGTAVAVFLPRTLVAVEKAPPPPVPPRMHSAGTVVLLVDDDHPVRSVTAAVLRDAGYIVLEAAGGETALAILEKDSSVDLLLTDLAMPGMNGAQLAMAARKRHPHLPVLFISGYADPEGLAGEFRANRLIRKPYRAADLREQVEAALSELHAPAD